MRWRYPVVVFRRTSVSSFNLARSSPVTCCSWCRNFRDGTLKDSQIWGQDSRPLPRRFRRPPQFESRCRASSLARLLLQQSDALLKCIHDRKGLREMAWYLYARKPVYCYALQARLLVRTSSQGELQYRKSWTRDNYSRVSLVRHDQSFMAWKRTQ